MESEHDPRIAVVVVTYNSAAVLPGCLDSLAEARGIELVAVVVADNNSADNSVGLAEGRDDLPVVTVRLSRNAGYSAGINAGIRVLDLTNLDAVFVTNPDVRVRPDALRRLARALTSERGITVPRLVQPDGSLSFSLRRAPSVRGAFAEAVIGGRRAGRRGGWGEVVTDVAAYEKPGPATWATGAAMLISANALSAVGHWDETFFLYSEETEYALRAADRGWSLWYEPEAVVEHIGGESKTNPRLAALLVVNKVRLFRRRHNAAAAFAYRMGLLIGQAARALGGSRTAWAATAALVRPVGSIRI
jgi:GT2 family glycosyltransferase